MLPPEQPTEMPISDNTAAFGSLGPPARMRSRRNKVRWSVPPCAEGERSRGESRAIRQYVDPRRAVGEQTRPPNRRWARDRVGRIDTNKDPDAAIRNLRDYVADTLFLLHNPERLHSVLMYSPSRSLIESRTEAAVRLLLAADSCLRRPGRLASHFNSEPRAAGRLHLKFTASPETSSIAQHSPSPPRC